MSFQKLSLVSLRNLLETYVNLATKKQKIAFVILKRNLSETYENLAARPKKNTHVFVSKKRLLETHENLAKQQHVCCFAFNETPLKDLRKPRNKQQFYELSRVVLGSIELSQGFNKLPLFCYGFPWVFMRWLIDFYMLSIGCYMFCRFLLANG